MSITESLPYDLREGWSDITPIPQNDPPDQAMAAIMYQPEYRHAMDAFRYVQSVHEVSQRAIDLTETILRKNAGMFTVWNYRSMLLTTLPGADLVKELEFMEGLIKAHLKGYQVWQHRKLVVLALNDPSRELGFCSRALKLDAKNYHTWAYRNWALCYFYSQKSTVTSLSAEEKRQVWQGELTYSNNLINDDIRNNSAWAHRFFVAFENEALEGTVETRATEEIQFALDKLKLVKHNASAWNYTRGILKKTGQPLSTVLPSVQAVADHTCPLAVEFEADALSQCLNAKEADPKVAEQAAKLYDLLGQQLDPIRAPYYAYRKSRLAL